MIDFFIGRSPTRNWSAEDPPLPIQKTVRELLQIARDARLERRKTTSDRRRMVDDYIVNLSNQCDNRVTPDRRQNQEFTALNSRPYDKRKNRIDRRKSVQEGIYVTLTSKNDRRCYIDRRGNKPL